MTAEWQLKDPCVVATCAFRITHEIHLRASFSNGENWDIATVVNLGQICAILYRASFSGFVSCVILETLST